MGARQHEDTQQETSGAMGYRTQSLPQLKRTARDHLPEDPVHQEVQGAQAAQGDPE